MAPTKPTVNVMGTAMIGVKRAGRGRLSFGHSSRANWLTSSLAAQRQERR
jgi:hypothetical protein